MENDNENLKGTKYGVQESCDDSEYMWDIVVAFDIGTSFSGYAYSDKKEIKRGSIVLNRWTGNMVKDEYAKSPTTILVSPDHKFHSFGYEAEENYAQQLANKSEGVWYRFRHFKMSLHYEKNVHRDMKIKDDTETIELRALDMFSYAIQYLKYHFEEATKQRNLAYDTSNVLYVITVPAIWKESAKAFMCEAALQAGIAENQLMIALEPEAAALYCQTLPDHTLAETFMPGCRYMMLDLGGGTVDTVVHDVLTDGTLVEVYKACGGPWGGTTVDEEFRSHVHRIFKEETCLQQLWENAPLDALDLERDFEVQKRQLTNNVEARIRLKLPRRLTMYGNVEADKSLTFDHLYVENEDFKKFFAKAKENITTHLQNVLAEVGHRVDQIIPVGGFSCSRYLLDQIKNHSGLQNICLCLTKDAGLAVLKGAVLFGYNPRTVSARISRYTYGISIMKNFDKAIHPQEKYEVVDGKEKCRDIFEILVYEGEKIGIDECRSTLLNSSHRNEDRKNVELATKLYMAKNVERNKISFVTDPDVALIGKIVNHPPEGGWPDSVEFRTDVYFGQTCIKVKDYDITNNIPYHAQFDLPE